MMILILLLAVIGTFSAPHIAATTNGDFTAPRFTVDLDLPPRKRWLPVFEGFLKLHGSWDYTGKPAFDYSNQFLTPDQWYEHNQTFVDIGLRVLGEEIVEESAGLCDFVNAPGIDANITLGATVFFQMFYELAMECTATLFQTPKGTLHGRNMDIGLTVENITGQITWRKNGKDLFTSTQFIGYNGVHTGMRHNGWSVQGENLHINMVSH